ncbi:MAG: aspartate/glutamate racemase family protein [Gemmatimonadaceae bacterium]
MKTIGIIGGTGPESTIEYYKRIIAAYRERSADASYPSMIINSINAAPLIEYVLARELDNVTELLVPEIDRLARAGADFGLIAANTPHVVFGAVSARSSIPLISIVEATADAAVARGLERLALFGTRLTMESDFYPKTFARRNLDIVVPNEEERTFIHDVYMGELFHGVIRQQSRDALVAIASKMKERDGIDGLILGGTELSLILTEPTYAGLPVLDTTQIHVDAIVSAALED